MTYDCQSENLREASGPTSALKSYELFSEKGN
jgi:hypothetical protein